MTVSQIQGLAKQPLCSFEMRCSILWCWSRSMVRMMWVYLWQVITVGNPGLSRDMGPHRGATLKGTERHPGKQHWLVFLDRKSSQGLSSPTCCGRLLLQGAKVIGQPGMSSSAWQSAQKPSPVLWSWKWASTKMWIWPLLWRCHEADSNPLSSLDLILMYVSLTR